MVSSKFPHFYFHSLALLHLGRRRLAPNRSLSITGLPITDLSGLDRASLSNLSASLVRSALRLTTASSTQDLPEAHGSVTEAQRLSIVTSLSRVLAPYCFSAAAGVANASTSDGNPHPNPAGNSRATSVLGEGRLSTSSAQIDQQHQSQTQHFRGSSGSINTWRHLSGLNAPPTATVAGSRMSLRSLSYASSTGSSAQSYNSFQLLAEHAGASWRELWRTRMLLMDVLRWAQAVAATNSTPAHSVANSNSYYPMLGTTALLGHQGNSGADLTASEIPPSTSSAAADETATTIDWTNQLSAMVMYLLGQVQQQQPEDPPPTGDPVLMAALVAATAAASAAMQQQQEHNWQHFAEGQPTTAAVGTENTVAKSPAGGSGSATTITAAAFAAPFPISSPHFVSPAASFPPPPPPPPTIPFYQMRQLPRFPAPMCVSATSPPQFCHRGPPDLLADHHRAFAQAAARAEENVCHLDASAATPNLQPPHPLIWGPGSPQSTGVSPADAGCGLSRPYPPMPTLYAAPQPPVPPSLRHYSPSQQWTSVATSVPRHCYPTVWHQPVEASPHLAPPSQTLFDNVSSSAMVPFGPPLTAFPAPALIPTRDAASPSTPAAAAASLSRWSVRTRHRARKKTPNDESGGGSGGGIGRSRDDSDAFDSEDEIISDADEKPASGDASADVGDGEQGILRVALMQASSQWPLPGFLDEGDSTGYSEAFEAIGGSTRPETEEDDGDISSVSQSASQVVPACAKSLGPPPKLQSTVSASGDPTIAAQHVPDPKETAKKDR
ncbi:unnamed protein product [Schistocephalus solidus]|uniref:Uncharacterized protein n=1 Tax=Schistocephalus solidus TaxID=70667 RepID=A0A183SKT0_SCHSO|nr:unnamed protein product [Schistocephalus solidus]